VAETPLLCLHSLWFQSAIKAKHLAFVRFSPLQSLKLRKIMFSKFLQFLIRKIITNILALPQHSYGATPVNIKEFNIQYPISRITELWVIHLSSHFTLNDDQVETVENNSKVVCVIPSSTSGKNKWSSNGLFIIDRVIGKHELITYSIALDMNHKVKGIEVLDFKESYGEQIHELQWRAQFIGKTLQNPLKLNSDIRNISGATLSCKNITNGVKRVLATMNVKYP
jgi:hypothetical protein